MADSYRKASAISPHDTDVLTGSKGRSWDAFYVGVSDSNAEDVTCIPIGQTGSVLFKNVLQGTIYPIATNRILATGTDAQSLVVLDTGGTYS
jgi:hypothetical protein